MTASERERIEADASEALVDANDLVASGAGHPACVAPIVQFVLRERAAAFENAAVAVRSSGGANAIPHSELVRALAAQERAQ